MTPREIGSKRAAALLGLSRTNLNSLAKAGLAPGLLRKEEGGYGNRGRYVFDADVIEGIARERIAALTSALDETRAAS
jgi:hypothetical protein